MSATDVKDIYDDFDPMQASYGHPINFCSFLNVDTPGGVLLEENAPEMNVSEKDIQCRFYDGKGEKCWKEYCPYMHEKVNSKNYDHARGEKIKKDALCILSELSQAKLASGTVLMEVQITNIHNPDKFFVVNPPGWRCSCEAQRNELHVRDVLESTLTRDMLNNSMHIKLRRPSYIKNQLVAIRRIIKRATRFQRAVVRHSVVDTRKSLMDVFVKVQLLDSGEKFNIKLTDVCTLPEQFVHGLPAMAMKCSLFGISPSTDRWTQESADYFREIILNKKCVLEIMKWTKKNTYEVELRVSCTDPATGEERFQSLKQMLEKNGHGIIYRPSITKFVSMEAFNLFGIANKPVGEPRENGRIMQSYFDKTCPQLEAFEAM